MTKEREALTPEQKDYYDGQVAKIRMGGSQHGAWAQDHIFGMGSYNLGPIEPPVVAFGQDDDPFYTQYLQNWDEVNALINDLRTEAEKAWGKEANHIPDAKNMAAQPDLDAVCEDLQEKTYHQAMRIAELEAMLAQPEQEHVACPSGPATSADRYFYEQGYKAALRHTTPPQRTWVGLTDEEEFELDQKYGYDFNVYIDQRDMKLKEKNT